MPLTGQSNSFDALLARGAAVLLGVALIWGVVVVAAVALEAITAGRVRVASSLGCPRSCHRWLLALATAAIAAATVTPGAAIAAADGGRSAPPGTELDGLRLPDRPTSDRGHFEIQHKQLPEPRARTPNSVSSRVTVRAGDSLWGISRSRFPPGAAESTVAELTRALYARNRSTIGSDPDLIQPGQHLAVPEIAPEIAPEAAPKVGPETYSEDS